MNKKYIAIIGAGAIGAAALILMRQPSTSQAGGAFGGGESKKEATTAVTESTEPSALIEPSAPLITYNISLPAPDFPAAPQPTTTEPWWVTSLEPPATKKAAAARPTYAPYAPVPTARIEDAPPPKTAAQRRFYAGIGAVQEKYYGGS